MKHALAITSACVGVLGIAWNGVAWAQDAAPTFTKDEKEDMVKEKLKADAEALDEKLEELFNVPQTPAAQALGLTGDAIQHPDTIKDVSLQVFAALSEGADLSQGVALEFAPFRQLVFKNLSLDKFQDLSDGELALSSLSFSLAALDQPNATIPGTSYAFGVRIAPIDQTDYRRNHDYITSVYSNLDSCLLKLTEPPLSDEEKLKIARGEEAIANAIAAWRAAKSDAKKATDTALPTAEALKKALAELPGTTDAAAIDALNARVQLLYVQSQLDAKAVDLANARQETARLAIIERFKEVDALVGERRDEALSDLRKTFFYEGGYPPVNDDQVEHKAELREARLKVETRVVCENQIDVLADIDKVLVGHRFELSTTTILFNPTEDEAHWSESNLALAYEYNWQVGFIGVAALGKLYDSTVVKGQIEGGVRGGFDAGKFSGAISAAGGAMDVQDPDFVFRAGAHASLVVSDTFLARLGVLTTYEKVPGFGATAYLSVATANGEDLFTKVLAHTRN